MDSEIELGRSVQTDLSDELSHSVQTDLSDELSQLLLELRLNWWVLLKELGSFAGLPHVIGYGILWLIDKEDEEMERNKILFWYPVVAFFNLIILFLLFRAKWNRYFKHWQENPDLKNLQIKQSKIWAEHYNIIYEPSFWVWQSTASFFVNLVLYVITVIVLGGLAYPFFLATGFFLGIALLLLGPVTLTCDDTATLNSLAAYARRASAPETNQ